MKHVINLALILSILLVPVPSSEAKGDDFNTVVKIIEQFYQVKHQSLPFLARAGVKTVTTAARLAGGTKRKIAEAGSVKVVFFEDQDFSSARPAVEFRTFLNNAIAESWTPLVQVMSDQDQSYIFVRNAGEKFLVLVVTIEKHDAVVVQVTVKPDTLARLLKDPETMGKTITDDATTEDQE